LAKKLVGKISNTIPLAKGLSSRANGTPSVFQLGGGEPRDLRLFFKSLRKHDVRTVEIALLQNKTLPAIKKTAEPEGPAVFLDGALLLSGTRYAGCV
jgi:hypothetical protein